MNLGKTVLYEVWAVPTVSHIGDTQLYPRRLQVVDEHETDERLSVVAGNWSQDELFTDPTKCMKMQVIRTVTIRARHEWS